ncbi:MAG: ferredoxin [Pseudomonadota bacterium]
MKDGFAVPLAELSARLAGEQLDIFGAFHPEPADAAPEDCETLVLLGPKEPGFWPRVTASPEFSDGSPDPIDRWSARVISAIAAEFGGIALFPFGGPPYRPFVSWARRTGRAWQSPVSLLVHDVAGLMVSYRGAIALPIRFALPKPPDTSPCAACHAPCVTACPADALTGRGYDLDSCHVWLDAPAGKACLNGGCAVRRACPISQSYGRLPAQSAYHMGIFHT